MYGLLLLLFPLFYLATYEAGTMKDKHGSMCLESHSRNVFKSCPLSGPEFSHCVIVN